MKSNASTSQQQPQQQTAQEIIAANIQTFIEQLEQSRSETLAAYLSASRSIVRPVTEMLSGAAETG